MPVLLTATALLLTACNGKEEEYMPPIELGNSDEVVVSVKNEDGTTSSMEAGTTIGFFVIDATGKVVYKEVKTDENGNALLPVGEGGKVIAYSPVQPGWGEAFDTPHVFSVKTNQAQADNFESSDLMLGTIQTTKAATTRSAGELPFSHVMAKIMVNVVDETGMMSFDNTTMHLLKMNNSVEVSLSDVSATTVQETRANIRMNPYNVTDRRFSAVAIVAPQQKEKDDDFFEMHVHGATQLFPFPETGMLLGNRTYTYNMRFTETGLFLDGSYVTNWVNDGSEELDIIIRP